ncbi:MAG: hypothetical protein ACI825_000765 [Planctomycetota bacterium]|jgi:hypothetical protein
MPFVGEKDSGDGREHEGFGTTMEFVNEKSVMKLNNLKI